MDGVVAGAVNADADDADDAVADDAVADAGSNDVRRNDADAAGGVEAGFVADLATAIPTALLHPRLFLLCGEMGVVVVVAKANGPFFLLGPSLCLDHAASG